MNIEIKALLRKNYWIQSKSYIELLKDMFIPLLSIAILFLANFSSGFTKTITELLLPIYVPSAFGGYGRKILIEFVDERSCGFRQTQQVTHQDLIKIMGMKPRNYRAGWLATYYIKSVLITIVITFAFIQCQGLNYKDVLFLTFVFQIYLFASINQTFLLSTFFNNSALAGEAGSFILTVSSFLYFAIFLVPERSFLFYFVVSLSPQAAFSMLLMSYISQEATFLKQEYSISFAISMLVFDFLSCLISFILLEELMIMKLSIKQLVKKIRRRSKRQNSSKEIEMLEFSDNLESKDLKNELEYSAVSIENLTKMYGAEVAVDNLNLKLQSQKIFTLLGHNGAGKTTTIKIMTGMTEKTSGKVFYYGVDLEENQENVQSMIGYCGQQDVLYENLTVEESLKFQAMVRGLDVQRMKSEIENIVKFLSIEQYANTLTKHLSGGNKRKLSIANAIIGDSKIIFLDEPTASIDPVSRRQIWDIILGLKQSGKTILLTTHFLDEAEFLSDKIFILRKGSLFIEGSPSEIRRGGYQLNVQVDNQEHISYIEEIINQNAINDFKIDQFKIQINFDGQQSDTIKVILQSLEEIGIQKVRLKRNSLEEVYLKLNEDIDNDAGTEGTVIRNQVFHISYYYDGVIAAFYQMIALLMKKYRVTFRNFNLIIMLILPLSFLILGVVIGGPYIAQMTVQQTQIKVYFVSMFIVQAFSLNSSIFIYGPLYERENRIRHQIRLLGCSRFVYWGSHLIFDYCLMLINVLVIWILLGSQYLNFFVRLQDSTLRVTSTFVFSLITYSYACSLFFESHKNAAKVFPVVNFLVGYSIPSILFDLIMPNQTLRFIWMMCSPFYVLDQGIRNTQRINTEEFYEIFLLVQGLVFLVIALLGEHLLMGFDNLVENLVSMDILNVNNLRHQFSGQSRLAIDNVNLKLTQSRILGLLGQNGAGKTTLINLITNIIRLQKGEIISKKDITLSVCQQQDCLWEELYAREALTIYGYLYGASTQHGLDREIDSLILMLSINQKVQILNMSGGQKRKVAIAIALLSRSDLILLDEPSMGLDPVSRRNLWQLIKDHVDQFNTSIILTTHHMEEAQYLSDDILMLSDGIAVVQQGQTADLLEQFSSNYTINIRASVDRTQKELNESIHDVIGDNFRVKCVAQDLYSYDFPRTERRFSQIFQTLSHLQQREVIRDFEIKQTSIEDVFLFYNQREEQ